MNTRLSEIDAELVDPCQPESRRAAVAVGLAPILVLAAFTLVVGGWLDADSGFAVFVACTAWVVFEMHRWQRSVDEIAEQAVGDSSADARILPPA